MQISHGDSLGCGNKSLFKWSWSHDQNGRHANLQNQKVNGNVALGYLGLPSLFKSGFIRVREMSVKFFFFQGQGIVREFYVMSGKNGCFLKCQGILPVQVLFYFFRERSGSVVECLT